MQTPILTAMQGAILLALAMVQPSCPSKQGGAPDQQRPETQPAAPDAPLTISMKTVGRFAKGYSWDLNVDSSGKARLEIRTYPDRTIREFSVPEAQLAKLRKALVDERFFELKDEYGENVPDGSTRTVTVTSGKVTKSVKLRFLMNWVHGDRERLREPARAVRVGLVIRDWFDDPQAVDLREYDRKIVAASPP